MRLVRWLLRDLLGVSWAVPRWLRWSGACARDGGLWAARHPARAGLVAVATIAVALGAHAGWQWYQARPKPLEVTFEVTNPPRTKFEEAGAKPSPVRIAFSHSVAPLALAGKPIASGIAVTPSLEGTWAWEGDRVLVFSPRGEWPVGTTYTVKFAERGLFRKEARFAAYRTTFTTAPFSVTITRAEFYQDPIDPAGKTIVATLGFSHPVDPREVQSHISLAMADPSAGLLGGPSGIPFKVTFDKPKLTAYVHSDPLPIPPKQASLQLTVAPGIRASLPGAPSADKLTQTVSIPGIDSLGIAEVAPTLVTNARFEPEQVVVVRTSALVHEKEINRSIHAYLLPRDHPDTPQKERIRPYAWSDGDIEHIGTELLKRADSPGLVPQPAEREVVDSFSYRYQAEPGRYVLVTVDKGLTSFGGYRLGEAYAHVFQVPQYPAEVKLLAQGSLLALSGEKKVSVLARDVPGVRYGIGRILPAQLQQLVAFGLRDGTEFSHPDFQAPLEETYLVERFDKTIALPRAAPGKPQYQAVDFAEYLEAGGVQKRGVFLLDVRGYDPQKNQDAGPQDRRLIVVTDLGLLSKRAADGSHDVFVQSIFSGEPVAEAQIEVVGRNGLTVLAQTTDSQGYAHLPSFKGYEREREPVMLIARKGADLCFLPYNRSDRRLDFSRFDVGGIADATDGGTLGAYLFSDRGIYRPGEEMRIGMIVKSADWTKPIAGVPLEIEITDPRGLTVRREKLRLSPTGLEELRHATLDTAPTGTYTVRLFVPKEDHSNPLVGSTTVRVQEFQPDRLRMSTRFSADGGDGWVSPQDLRARVSLQNLFGTPAEDRRVDAVLTLSPSLPRFPGYSEYQFSDPQHPIEGLSEKLGEARTSQSGEAEFDLKLQRFANATYRAHVLAQGYEADGGRGVSAEAAVLVSNLEWLLGVKPDGDFAYVKRGSRRTAELVAVDRHLKKVPVDGLTLTRVEQRFVSVLTRQPSGVYKYESKEKEIALDQKPFAIPAGGIKLDLATEAPGTYAYVVRNRDGLEFARVRYNVAGEANLERALDKNAELKLTLAKSDVAPGEEIEVQIEAPYSGTGLLAVERDKVYAFKWFRASTTSTVQHITLPAGLEGNAYLTVTFVRDLASEEIYTSPLSYGVAPFSISLGKHRTELKLDVPERMRPGDSAKLTVSSPIPTRAIVFAVDEGVLQVARYKSPDPLGYFFQKRALGVGTSQILDLILPEFSRVMAAAPGGDAEGALGKFLNPFKRKRDPAVAYWSGVVDIGPTPVSLDWIVPESFNGSLRVLAVAVGDGTIGVAERKSVVRGDFVITPNLPLAVAPGDEFEATVGIANTLAESGADAKVAFDLTAPAQFEVLSGGHQLIPIAALHEGVAHVRLRARKSLGSGTLAFAAGIGGRVAHLHTDVSVRPASPFRQDIAVGVLKRGSVDVPVGRRMHDAYRTLEASISSVPLGLSHGLAAYLADFQYSCTEQLVSKGFPALVLASRPEFGYLKSKPGSDLDALVGVLRSRQNAEGAYGLWAANPVVVDTASVYAQHFLLEANERGRAVPADVLAKGNVWLEQYARTEGGTLEADRTRAYAIYLLTRQGRVTSGLASALQRRLDDRDRKRWKKDAAAVWLAATYRLLKQDNLAAAALSDFELGVPDKPVQSALSPVHTDPYYDALVRDATALYLYARHFPERIKALPADAFEAIVAPLRRGDFTTYSSAQLLLAFDAVASLAQADGGVRFEIAELLANKTARPLALPPGLVPRIPFFADATGLRFANPGNLPGFWVVDQSGFDLEPSTTAVRDGLEILREYTDAAGHPVSAVRLGDEIEVHLKFRSLRGELDNVAIVDLLPGGFDLVQSAPAVAANDNAAQAPLPSGVPEQEAAPREGGDAQDAADAPRGDDDGARAPAEPPADDGAPPTAVWQPGFGMSPSHWQADFADQREDRIVLYGHVGAGVQEFVYRLKATTLGTFTVPPAYAEAMYDRTVRAGSPAGTRLVVNAGARAPAAPIARVAAKPAAPAKK